MGNLNYKPTSPGRRFQVVSDFSGISKKRPCKSLVRKLNSHSGRNNQGRITTRHRGGRHKRLYRMIDFKRRDKAGVPAKVMSIEYDPNRSARIALLLYADGERRYILAPLQLKHGHSVMCGADADIQPGNAMEVGKIPVGTMIHNVELKIGKGGQIVRSAGGGAQVMAKDKQYVHIKLPSGEVRLVHANCYGTIGQLGNIEHENVKLGKAGRKRWLGRRSTVRGVAMNPVDHPMGGGEGRSSGGRHPCTPQGKPTKGLKTRRNKRTSKFVVKKRRK